MLGFAPCLLVLCILAVSAGCLLPARYLPPLPNDKLLHFAAFAVLSLIAAQVAENWQQQLIAYAGLFLLGWLLEYLQQWVPGRSFCWRDMAANAAGIFSAALLVLILTSVFQT